MRRILIVLCVLSVALHAQTGGHWVKGKSTVYGSDFRKMQIEAVKRARADALNQAGIVVSASSYRVQTESNKSMNDYYSQFTEASSRGIITQERNIKLSDPVRVSEKSLKSDVVFQMDAELDAYVVIPKGEVDPGFTVMMKTPEKTVRETDPVEFGITSSRDGYLTLLHVKNDTIEVAFPNGLSKNNRVDANKQLVFPKDYQLFLTVDKGDQSSNEEFIAIVTKENQPLAPAGDVKIIGDELQMTKLSLDELSQWLFKLPLNQRAITHMVMTVVK